MLARRRRHLLRPDRRPPQAQPGGRRLHLGPPLRPRAGARRRAARRSSCARPRASGSCRCSSSTAGRPRTTARSSRSPSASSSSRCGSPPRRRRPSTSAPASGRRSRSRSSRSPPPARETRLTLAAAGVANIPRSLDPADPLAGLPGHPQSAWKRTVLATLVERATRAGGLPDAWVATRAPSRRGCPRCGRAARGRPRDPLGLLPVLDLADPGPEIGCGGERGANQVGVRARRRCSPRGRR